MFLFEGIDIEIITPLKKTFTFFQWKAIILCELIDFFYFNKPNRGHFTTLTIKLSYLIEHILNRAIHVLLVMVTPFSSIRIEYDIFTF